MGNSMLAMKVVKEERLCEKAEEGIYGTFEHRRECCVKRNGKSLVGCCSEVFVLRHVFSKEPRNTNPRVVTG